MKEYNKLTKLIKEIIMRPSECLLTVFSNKDDENPKICVKNKSGNWIVFSTSSEKNDVLSIDKQKPDDCVHPLRITKEDIRKGNYLFLIKYTIDFLEIIDTNDTKEEQKNKIIYEVKTMRMLLDNDWHIYDIPNYGIIILSTELDITLDIK
ncbi:MAG: hypothetical protein GY863_16875 [bacterium]|nr:hypothetical protein [bacterium]